MALVYPNATLSPSKRELMAAWLPTRPWFDGRERKPVGSFRFDDPDGQVGLEGFLLGGEELSTLFLPLTYRAAALEGAEDHLVGTTEHSELGRRWVYDGCGDPVLLRSLAHAILTGATGVDHEFDIGNGQESMPTNAQVRGSGSADTAVPEIDAVGSHDEGPLTIVNAGPLELVIARIVGTGIEAAHTLAVTWKGGTDVAIAGVRPA
jgi:hypothetical protein